MTAFASPGAAQSVDAIEELRICAGLADQEARLACFDDLSERVLQEETADKSPTQEKTVRPEAETATPRVAQPLPDELGNAAEIEYVGLITSCKKGHYGDWFFFFDNGQVWKEVKKRNRRFKECNFNVTITKDAFGYKMRIEGEDRTIRVRRHR